MLVVDTSVALKWFLAEEGTEEAAALLDGSRRLVAPDLIIAETVNVGWRIVRAGMMTADQLQQMALTLPRHIVELVALSPLAPRAATIAGELNHPAYDCFFVALAEQRSARLVTADRRLFRRVQGTPWQPLIVPLTG